MACIIIYVDAVASTIDNLNVILVTLAIAALLMCAVGVCVFAIAWANFRSRQSRKRVIERYVTTLFPLSLHHASVYDELLCA